jgi:hypothetical protein
MGILLVAGGFLASAALRRATKNHEPLHFISKIVKLQPQDNIYLKGRRIDYLTT